MRSVVITGTSTGIGWGTAKVLIAHGLRVFGSVRKTADAERLSAEFGDAFVPLLFDVTDEAAVNAAAAQVRAELGGEKLAGLVNNAASLSSVRLSSCRSRSFVIRSRSISLAW
jgi:NAD(P)-dependent dehydrogenase (short-subunit alcohol dehydrogenase family)